MATSKKTNTTEKETIKLTSIKLPEKNARKVGNTIFFTMTLNGVTIYNCRVVNGSKGKFIAFPQTKGKDGNYYSQAYAPLSENDQKKIIEKIESYVEDATPDDTDSEELPFA